MRSIVFHFFNYMINIFIFLGFFPLSINLFIMYVLPTFSSIQIIEVMNSFLWISLFMNKFLEVPFITSFFNILLVIISLSINLLFWAIVYYYLNKISNNKMLFTSLLFQSLLIIWFIISYHIIA